MAVFEFNSENLPTADGLRHLLQQADESYDPLAELLFGRGLEHAKKNDRDGDIYRVELPAVALKIGNPTKAAAALVDAGLWVETGDGWRIRSFLKWNLSQAEQAEERERKQAAAILGNHKRHHKTERSADCIHCQEAMK